MNRGSRGFAALLLALAAAGCAGWATGPEEDVVSWGSGFGMCVGYCTTMLEVRDGHTTLIESSRDSAQFPTRRRTMELNAGEWTRVRALASAARVESVAGVHGCPDCADGGAEWIQVRTTGRAVRTTFEFGNPPAPVAELQAALRAIRARFQ